MTESVFNEKSHDLSRSDTGAGDIQQADYDDIQFIGSPKQIAWAKEIYASKVNVIDKLIADVKTRVAGAEVTDYEREQIDRFFVVAEAVRNSRKASFWIDQRDADFSVGTSYIEGRIFDALYKGGWL